MSGYRLWIVCGLALCGVFAGLAVLGASVPVILCVGFPVLIVSLWYLVALLEDALPIISNQLNEVTRELKKR